MEAVGDMLDVAHDDAKAAMDQLVQNPVDYPLALMMKSHPDLNPPLPTYMDAHHQSFKDDYSVIVQEAKAG